MMDDATQKLVDGLRLDARDYGRKMRGEVPPEELISWDQSNVRAWEAADALEAQRPPVSPEQYAIRFRPPGRAVWRYVDYPDLPTAVEEFGDYADETHPQIVKRTEPEAWREVSLNEAQERFSFAREVQAGLDRQRGADHG